MKPSLCVIHEVIGPNNAIAKIAMLHVQTALDAGWQVSVVAKILDSSLHDRVIWLPLTVPRRSFFLQWTTARHFIRRAIGDRKFDVIHAHQPQVADMSDVFSCHFLTRVAYERNCLESRRGLRPRLVRLQQQGVLYAEDRCYARWNPQTRMLFCSQMMQSEFSRLYGAPASEQVLVNPCPPMVELTTTQRRSAREKMIGSNFNGIVIGYLGGVQARKGYQRLIHAIAADENLFLLMAGPYTEGFSPPELKGRLKTVGLIDDVASFYAACDVVIVPSLFEPLGMVAFEAAAHGVPVIATDEVGALPHLVEYGAGARWNPAAPLDPLVRQLVASAEQIRSGAARMADELSQRRHGERLLAVYDDVLQSKNRGSVHHA
jgi:UDP-glucose:(heptosyl)LPS alpha-1,3-glucosyltransferase